MRKEKDLHGRQRYFSPRAGEERLFTRDFQQVILKVSLEAEMTS